MIFVKEYLGTDTAAEELNADIKENPQWSFEVVGYTSVSETSILVKWVGLSQKEFVHAYFEH